MNTEYEYLRFLQDNKVKGSPDGEDSFFRSIVGVERSSGQAAADKQKIEDENLALKEINDTQIKKIQELQKQMAELEEEN